MEKHMKKFYDETKDIVMYPGSLEELNWIKGEMCRGNPYDILRIEGSKPYVTGVIIPSPTELRELMGLLNGVRGGLGDLFGESFAEIDDTLDEVLGNMEPLMMKLFGTPAMLKSDIRLKAKKMGAHGLIHVQMYSKDGLYSGVPVKLIG